MLFSVRTSLGPAVLLGWLLAAGAASAATPGVEDGAGFFSAEAVQKAQNQAKEIKSRFNKDVRVETFKTVPADRQAGQNLQDEGARRQFFRKWVDDRIKQTQLRGVLVLMTRSPGHVEVGVSEDTLKKGFTAADRDKLGKLLLDRFKEKKFDEGLLDGVRLVEDTLARNLPVVNVVKDAGGFFTPEAVRKADAELKEINSRTKKNIIIETFKTAPASDVQRLEAMTTTERNSYYANWARNRVQGLRFCVYVLITREPGHVQVAVGPEGEGGAFTSGNRGDLEEILLTAFRKKEFDQGLAKATDYIHKTLYAHLNVATTPPRPAGTVRTPAETARATAKADTVRVPEIASATKRSVPATNPETQKAVSGVGAAGGGDDSSASKGGFKPMWILWIVLGLLGLWILYGIFRGLTHRPQVGPAGGYPAPGQAYGAATGQHPPPLPGQQVGPHYAAGQAVPPGAPGYAPGYGAGQPMGGYGAGMPYGGGGGGGGGFLSGMLGGMFGAAAGNWVYDSFIRGPHSQPTGGGFGSRAYGGEPHQYGSAPPAGGSTAGPAAGAAAGGFSSTGGDFDASSGQPVETSGGDFDAGDDRGDTGAGGDFGEAANTADTGAGGDFGADEDTGSGGDFGGDAGADSGGGGDFGGGDTSGGDFGGDSGGGDFGGGGDTGSSDGGGGDF